MKIIKYFVILVLIFPFSGCTKYVKIYDGSPGTEEEPRDPILTVEGAPAKGELTFEKTTGEGDTKETIKLAVKSDTGGWGNPFTWFGNMITNIAALIFRTAGGIAVPVGS